MAQQIELRQNTPPAAPGAPSPTSTRQGPRAWLRSGRFWGMLCFYVAILFFVVNILGLVGTVVVDALGSHWFYGSWLPQGFTTQWYQYELGDHDFGSLLFNTLFVALAVTIIALPTALGAQEDLEGQAPPATEIVVPTAAPAAPVIAVAHKTTSERKTDGFSAVMAGFPRRNC